MCGLAGFISFDGGSGESLSHTAHTMISALAHRGPDSGDVWVDASAGIALGHRRLSIVDLSPSGHQPMASACQRFVIVYNGEIYNAPEVARELPHIEWRGHSDTEVLLEACAAWGMEAAVARFNGIFAFVLWDRNERRLYLGRDRLGIKPLYYGRQNGVFLFGSELKALRAHPACQAEVDPAALAGYMRLANVPGTQSIYKGIHKLAPGHILSVDAQGERLSCYWNLRTVACNGQNTIRTESAAALTEELDHLLRDAVQRQMVADVPLGAFLSGGIDSSTVTALMQASASRPVRTFSIGFEQAGFNEADHARTVASHLGTEHTELTVSDRQALDTVPLLADIYDEPFADASQIPTYLVSKLAKPHVTVALSGDGGDELFAGYTRHQAIDRLWQATGRLPGSLRKGTGRALQLLSPDAWDALISPVPSHYKPRQFGDKLHKAAAILAQDSLEAMYREVVSYSSADLMQSLSAEPAAPWDDGSLSADLPDTLARLRYLDMATYLPNDILTKVDRASMAVALEARVPLLDHRVVEFAWSLPRDVLIHNGKGKHILRNVLYKYVPRHLVERPKAGFSVPLNDWLRGPLREWAEDLLSEQSLKDSGLLNPSAIRHLLAEHNKGRSGLHHRLWMVLMLQAWARRWL